MACHNLTKQGFSAQYVGVASRARPCPHIAGDGSREHQGRALAGLSGSAYQGVSMAKALYGHVGAAPDRRLLDEVTRLRARVQALEFEITRLRADNDRLAAAAAEADDLL